MKENNLIANVVGRPSHKDNGKHFPEDEKDAGPSLPKCLVTVLSFK